jgi:hypothetical protein
MRCGPWFSASSSGFLVIFDTPSQMEWGYENIKRGWREFASHIRFEMETTPRLDFGLTFGVRIRPSRKLSRICILLLALKMLMWQIIWSYLLNYHLF